MDYSKIFLYLIVILLLLIHHRKSFCSGYLPKRSKTNKIRIHLHKRIAHQSSLPKRSTKPPKNKRFRQMFKALEIYLLVQESKMIRKCPKYCLSAHKKAGKESVRLFINVCSITNASHITCPPHNFCISVQSRYDFDLLDRTTSMRNSSSSPNSRGSEELLTRPKILHKSFLYFFFVANFKGTQLDSVFNFLSLYYHVQKKSW